MGQVNEWINEYKITMSDETLNEFFFLRISRTREALVSEYLRVSDWLTDDAMLSCLFWILLSDDVSVLLVGLIFKVRYLVKGVSCVLGVIGLEDMLIGWVGVKNLMAEMVIQHPTWTDSVICHFFLMRLIWWHSKRMAGGTRLINIRERRRGKTCMHTPYPIIFQCFIVSMKA